MKKETKGLIAQIEEDGNVANYTPKGITIDDLYKFNTEIDKSYSKPIIALTSIDNGEYLRAVMIDDKVKIKFYEDKFEKERLEREKALYKRMRKELSWYGFYIFKLINKTFEDGNSYYSNEWYAKDIKVQFGDEDYYGQSHLNILLKDGKYTLYFWYSDETGYDQGKFTIAKDIAARNIFKEIEKVKLTPNFR